MTTDVHPFLTALMGGVLIGLAAGGYYLVQGRIAGISSIARAALLERGSAWRWAFLVGLLLVGVLHAFSGGEASSALAATPLSLLGTAGLLVGLGSGIGSGCTSGHGVCGLARLSLRSLAAVGVFMFTASVTVFVMRHVIAL